MGITNFPHGIMATPSVGAGLGYGWKTNSTTYFVDNNEGGDGNAGTSPETAFATIAAALSAADKWDVIYVAPKDWTSGNLWLGTPYIDTTDLAIPYAKHGIALIGIGHQGINGSPYGTVIQEVSASTAALLKVDAPMCAIENLAFYNASTAVNGIHIDGDVAGTSEAALVTVYNCHFHTCVGAGAQGDTGGAIFSEAAWGTTVIGCTFLGCRVGVAVRSSGATSGKTLIKYCDFGTRNVAVSDISADIYHYTQGSTWVGIDHCNMGHAIPAYSGGSAYFIIVHSDVRQGYITNCVIGASGDTALTHGPAGTGIRAPKTVTCGNNYSEGAICTFA